MDGTRMKTNNRHNKGYTMVEVIISFGILMMIAAVFSNVFLFSGRLTAETARALEDYEGFSRDYYLKEGIKREAAAEGNLVFRQQNAGDGGEPEVFIISGVKLYQNTSSEGKAGRIYDVDGD